MYVYIIYTSINRHIDSYMHVHSRFFCYTFFGRPLIFYSVRNINTKKMKYIKSTVISDVRAILCGYSRNCNTLCRTGTPSLCRTGTPSLCFCRCLWYPGLLSSLCFTDPCGYGGDRNLCPASKYFCVRISSWIQPTNLCVD